MSATTPDAGQEGLVEKSVIQASVPRLDDDNHAKVETGEKKVSTGVDDGDGSGPDRDEDDGRERWNSSRGNVYRFCIINLSLLVMGMHDASALIPYIEPYYGINYIVVSTLFLVGFAGYLVAALTNNWLHYTAGQRGIALLGPACRLVAYVPMSLHPPFPVLPVVMLFAAYGNGLEDSAWNAWVGNMHHSNELLGIVHGAYGLGATISPLVASAMVTRGNVEWYTFYYLMAGVSCVQLVAGVVAFWTATGAAYRRRLQYGSAADRLTTRAILRTPIPWLIAFFLLGYVGAEVSLGGWIPTFMLRVRHSEAFLAGLSVTLFWLGLTLGRVLLGFVTGRVGEKLAIACYLALSIVLEVLYWLVPSFVASVVFVVLLGFFLGPLFPAAIVVATKLLPPSAHVSAIGFAAAFGSGGAAVFPFAVGAIAQSRGVAVLQPFVLAIFVFITLVWLLVPGGLRKGGLERARTEELRVGEDVCHRSFSFDCPSRRLILHAHHHHEFPPAPTQRRQIPPFAGHHRPTPLSLSPPPSTMPPPVKILPLPPFTPELHDRAWASAPHPTLPLLATAHAKSVTVYSLSSLSAHSALTGGHSRSVRCAAWKPGLAPHRLCLVSGSFDSTAGVWRWDGNDGGGGGNGLEVEITAASAAGEEAGDGDDADDKEWEFTLVLEGHDSEIKSCAFSPSGAYLATCSRDKSVWIWEDIGASETDDEWETIAVLNEHDGDVKAVAWCPDVPGRNTRRRYAADVLASASYDNTVRVWREDPDGEWVCVAALEGHAGTVWGVQWEARPRDGDAFPRLASFSADGTVRIWTLSVDDEEDGAGGSGGGGGGGGGSGVGFGGIPNTMRRSLREEWTCTAVLPRVHDKDVYSVSWSAQSGILASTGSDGTLALYQETPAGDARHHAATNGDAEAHPDASPQWAVLATLPNAHGPYEVNHVTWCRRYDAACERKGEEEMLVTTGDDGVVRPWQVVVPPA
ncbi:hypothetical protein S7711_05252 [Stachybotrys chartarum IBT 7711]|uniref:Probable cytosolic iron-sulfur protein assembly protein 1 n=1 Tax=Stachybotrys chartarum (strain CBS 109288 / IBT 7711) TaxID=1280523 RepID=A0A084AGK4_STACB|nr:hypothetical protein S7711_05252 [Stachybotrys chartarum IBT 7711]